MGARGGHPEVVYPAASQIASWVVGPLVVIALLTGVTQALGSGWGLVRYWRVAIKLAVTVTLTAIVWVVLVPRLAASARAADAGAAFTTVERLPLVLVPGVAVALLTVLVALAIYRPGVRIGPVR